MADPFFAKVVESQKAWVERVVFYELYNAADQRLAYEHFFSSSTSERASRAIGRLTSRGGAARRPGRMRRPLSPGRGAWSGSSASSTS